MVTAMGQIHYRVGDATSPACDGPAIIAHICNDQGLWGKGFVVAISRRWREPEAAYRRWWRGSSDFGLGAIQVIQVLPCMWVANMIGQHGISRHRESDVPIRYEAVQECLQRLAEQAVALDATIHMPRIGCGLAGGQWDRIKHLIESELIGRGLNVTVYDLP